MRFMKCKQVCGLCGQRKTNRAITQDLKRNLRVWESWTNGTAALLGVWLYSSKLLKLYTWIIVWQFWLDKTLTYMKKLFCSPSHWVLLLGVDGLISLRQCFSRTLLIKTCLHRMCYTKIWLSCMFRVWLIHDLQWKYAKTNFAIQ